MKLSQAIKILSEAGIENARADARALFLRFSDLTQAELLLADAELDSDELTRAVYKRAQRYPLQYIIGRVDFYRESYKVTEDCLIPRSDTEILVDEVIKRLPDGAHFLDLCTGSGCVALSVLNNTKGTTAHAADISAGALAVAAENAKSLGLEKRFTATNADVLSERIEDGAFAVVSNPPYVTSSAYKTLEKEIYAEPSIAFLAGDDGLKFYKRIIPLYKDHISPDGFFAFEIGYDQGEALLSLAEENSLICEIIKDYSANDRVAILKNK